MYQNLHGTLFNGTKQKGRFSIKTCLKLSILHVFFLRADCFFPSPFRCSCIAVMYCCCSYDFSFTVAATGIGIDTSRIQNSPQGQQQHYNSNNNINKQQKQHESKQHKQQPEQIYSDLFRIMVLHFVQALTET